MVFRVQRARVDDTVVLTLSGDIVIDEASALQALVAGETGRQLVLDLADASIVDRAGVRLLLRAEAAGATLSNCPGYVRAWIERERTLEARTRDDVLEGAKEPMTQSLEGTASESTFQTADGLRIFFRSWHPNGRPRGIVAIVPGFNSHSGYYGWVAEQLTVSGLAVFAVDLRGRGRSDGERFYVNTFSDYVDDVAGLVRVAAKEHPGLPMFVLGHSAGGVVSCLYALDRKPELAGLICESFAFQVPAPDFALAVFKGLSHIAPHAHVLHLKNEDFSRDPDVVDRMNADPLIAHESQPTQTLAEMVRADERLKEGLAAISLPLLILHGTADRATKPAGSQFFYDKSASPDKTLKLYDGYLHDLLNDVGKDIVMTDITAWIEGRLPGSASPGADD